MSAWFRLGPFGVSSRGRVGANVGPVSVTGGGGGLSEVFAALFGIGLLVMAITFPLSLIGHAVGFTPSWHDLWYRESEWKHEH